MLKNENIIEKLVTFKKMCPMLIYLSMDSYNFPNFHLQLFCKNCKSCSSNFLSNIATLHLKDLGSQDTRVGHDLLKLSSKYINDLNRTTKISFPPLNGDFSLNGNCLFPNMSQSCRWLVYKETNRKWGHGNELNA